MSMSPIIIPGNETEPIAVKVEAIGLKAEAYGAVAELLKEMGKPYPQIKPSPRAFEYEGDLEERRVAQMHSGALTRELGDELRDTALAGSFVTFNHGEKSYMVLATNMSKTYAYETLHACIPRANRRLIAEHSEETDLVLIPQLEYMPPPESIRSVLG